MGKLVFFFKFTSLLKKSLCKFTKMRFRRSRVLECIQAVRFGYIYIFPPPPPPRPFPYLRFIPINQLHYYSCQSADSLLLWDHDPITCVQTNIVWHIRYRYWRLIGCTLPAFSSFGGSLQGDAATDWPSGWTWGIRGSSVTHVSLECMLYPSCPWLESFQVYSLERVRCCWDYLDA